MLHGIGGGLAVLGLVFVAIRLKAYSASLDISRLTGASVWLIGASALLYGLATMMLAMAWRNLLLKLGSQVSLPWAIKIYSQSQLAKYVPGNIFHLAGRQALGMTAGLPAWALAKSSVWELALLALSGSLLGLLALPYLNNFFTLQISLSLFGAGAALVAALLYRLLGRSACRAFLWQLSFLFVSGLLFAGLVALLQSKSDLSMPPILALSGAYVLAWLVGLVTPGAPAGVGVREMVLLYLLRGAIVEADLLLAVLLGRIVSVSGDIFIYFISIFIHAGRHAGVIDEP